MKSDLVAELEILGALVIRQNPTWPPQTNNNFKKNKDRVMRNTIFSCKSYLRNSFLALFM